MVVLSVPATVFTSRNGLGLISQNWGIDSQLPRSRAINKTILHVTAFWVYT
jgi:hypothetical protein